VTESLLHLPSFQRPAVSPSGDWLAYLANWTGRYELYITTIHSHKTKKVTEGGIPGGLTLPILWEQTDDRIYVHTTHDGSADADITAVDREGDLTPLITKEGKCVLRDVGPNNRYLLFTQTTYPETGPQTSLHCYDQKTASTTEFTEYQGEGGCFSPDGEWIASQDTCGVFLTRVDGGERRHLQLDDMDQVTAVDWHPTQERLLLSGETPGIHHLNEDTTQWIEETGEYDDRAISFTPDGRRILVNRTYDVTECPIIIDPESGTQWSLNTDGAVSWLPSWTGDNITLDEEQILVVYTCPTTRPELLTYDLERNQSEVLLEARYGDIDPAVFVDPEYVTYESADGLEIGALLYRARANSSPAIVAIHGGPHQHVTKSLKMRDLWIQYLVQHGYTVLRPNYRGSTGRGSEFQSLIKGDWGNGDAIDIKSAGEFLATREWIKDDQLSVFGHSYGGYSVYVQLTRYPTFWNAGVAWNGWTDPGGQWYNPLDNVQKLEDPLLILAGENDPTIEDQRRFRDAHLGQEREENEKMNFIELTEYGHFNRDPDRNIEILCTILDFLDRCN